MLCELQVQKSYTLKAKTVQPSTANFTQQQELFFFFLLLTHSPAFNSELTFSLSGACF